MIMKHNADTNQMIVFIIQVNVFITQYVLDIICSCDAGRG